MIWELLYRQKKSNKIGIICGENKLSYKDWHELSKKLSEEVLKKIPQKIVGLFLPNSIAYAVSYFSCLYADKIIAPLYLGSTMFEIYNTMKYCEISVLIITQPQLDFVRELSEKYNLHIEIILINDNAEIIQVISLNKDIPINNINDSILEDVIILLHTSGTTSNPKRVMLTNRGLLNNIKAHCESLGLNENEVSLIQLPMMFGYCNTAQFLTHVYLGACVVINANPFMVADFYKIIEKWRVTNFTAVPTLLVALYNSKILPYDISSLKIVCFGGSPISKNFLENIIKKFPTIAFVQTYGLTEAGPRVTTLSPSTYDTKVGSVGSAISGVEIKIIDDFGNTIGCNEIGEVIIKSNSIMKGYFKSPEETAAVVHKNWLYSGDMGYVTKDGYLYIVGRKKNIIISGGKNICPEEIEEVIMSCTDIVDAKVYGVFDELLGECVCADIVINSDCVNTICKLKTICSNSLSEYKIPREIHVVKKISRTYNGKIKR